MTACATGCVYRTSGAERVPVQVDGEDLLCRRCTTVLDEALTAIPERYALLHGLLLPGSTEPDPGTKRTKQPHPPVPVRLVAVDLLDERLAFSDGQPTENRRGALGVLHGWASLVRQERRSTPPLGRPTVTGEAACLRRHLAWITKQAWSPDLLDEVRDLARELADAVGEHRPRPVGVCTVVPDHQHGSQSAGDAQSPAEPCGGPLLPQRHGGVRCLRCGDLWGTDDLRRLGLLLQEAG